MSFYEAIWHGEGIGDGCDLEESLQAYIVVKPEDGDWTAACAKDGANPHVDHYSSFDAYLDRRCNRDYSGNPGDDCRSCSTTFLMSAVLIRRLLRLASDE